MTATKKIKNILAVTNCLLLELLADWWKDIKENARLNWFLGIQSHFLHVFTSRNQGYFHNKLLMAAPFLLIIPPSFVICYRKSPGPAAFTKQTEIIRILLRGLLVKELIS